MAETVYGKVNQFGRFEATDQMSDEIMQGLKGKQVKSVMTMPRNYEHHKKYFTMLGVVFDAQAHYAQLKDMRGDIMIALGYFKTITSWDGSTRPEPESISFANMDQTKFDEVYSRTLDFVAEKIIPGINRADLVREIEGFL